PVQGLACSALEPPISSYKNQIKSALWTRVDAPLAQRSMFASGGAGRWKEPGLGQAKECGGPRRVEAASPQSVRQRAVLRAAQPLSRNALRQRCCVGLRSGNSSEKDLLDGTRGRKVRVTVMFEVCK